LTGWQLPPPRIPRRLSPLKSGIPSHFSPNRTVSSSSEASIATTLASPTGHQQPQPQPQATREQEQNPLQGNGSHDKRASLSDPQPRCVLSHFRVESIAPSRCPHINHGEYFTVTVRFTDIQYIFFMRHSPHGPRPRHAPSGLGLARTTTHHARALHHSCGTLAALLSSPPPLGALYHDRLRLLPPHGPFTWHARVYTVVYTTLSHLIF
jgi:hypothetical protein